MYEIIEDNEKDDEKQIEETKQVEQKTVFSIGELKREIGMLDDEITLLQARKKEMENKITAVSSELKLTIK